ncbi:hypothetical protein J6590_035497 [Homalodisca vitripennis]|nr:hypothetical protein J6590_035497 [Homalodisca vitripennis]
MVSTGRSPQLNLRQLLGNHGILSSWTSILLYDKRVTRCASPRELSLSGSDQTSSQSELAKQRYRVIRDDESDARETKESLRKIPRDSVFGLSGAFILQMPPTWD